MEHLELDEFTFPSCPAVLQPWEVLPKGLL